MLTVDASCCCVVCRISTSSARKTESRSATLRVGQPIEGLAGTPLRNDEVVTAKHGQMLGQVGCLEARVCEQIGDRYIVTPGEYFEHPHSNRMGEALEEVGLHLMERAMDIGVFGHAPPDSTS